MAHCAVQLKAAEDDKVYCLAKFLKIDPVHAFGYMVRLWIIPWAYQKYDGKLRKSPSFIARECGWSGQPETFISALVDSRLLDEDGDQYTVHDWTEHQGTLVKKLSYDQQRKQEERALAKMALKGEAPKEFGPDEERERRLLQLLDELGCPNDSLTQRKWVQGWLKSAGYAKAEAAIHNSPDKTVVGIHKMIFPNGNGTTKKLFADVKDLKDASK